MTVTRIAILNRGEPAVRFCRAVADYNAERGTSLSCVALYTDPDHGAPFTRLADRAVGLGPALAPDGNGGMRSPYLDIDKVLSVLRRTGCDAVWPGWGFVAEDAAFAARLEAADITFLGPSSEAMRRLGDKIASKLLAARCGVPMAPWWQVQDDSTPEQVRDEAEKIGYPLMVKASAGGGGRGIRKVDRPEDLLAAITSARDEVAKVFGVGGLFLEACVVGARHVEVQLLADDKGRAVALGVRDCSIQRRNQKVLEEAPSPVLPDATAKLLCESSVKLAEAAGYRSAGTAEFLYDPRTDTACFLEVNSRLQVEHTVTECITGVDLVHGQIDVARGLGLAPSGAIDAAGDVVGHRGWAIEARLCAEDGARGFAPSPGLLKVFRVPAGPGIRVDSGVAAGQVIAPEFDSMIAKVIATGVNRAQAIGRLRRALRELQVVVEDGATNKALLLELLERPEVLDGSADTGWLDRALQAGDIARDRRGFEALCFAAVVDYRRQRLAEIHGFLAAAQDGIPQNPPRSESIEIELAIGGRRLAVRVHDLGRDRYLVGPQGRMHVVSVVFDDDCAATLTLLGERHDVRFAYGDKGVTVEVDGAMHTVEPASGGAIKAPAPAMVVQVAVTEGERVTLGQRLLTLEAMKLEMPLFATEAGVVKSVLCSANQQVNPGQVLVVLQPEGESAATDASDIWPVPAPTPLEHLFAAERTAAAGPDFRRLDAMSEQQAAEAVGDLVAAGRSVMLGYDVSEAFAAGVNELLGGDLQLSKLEHPDRWLPIIEVLRCFADVEALFDRTLPLDETAPMSLHSQFYEACRCHQQGEDGVPEALRPALTRALGWYDLRGIEPTERYREALFRLHIGHANGERRHQLCSLLLRTAIAMHDGGVDVQGVAGLDKVLDRISRLASPKQRYVSDNARQAEYVLYAQPRYMRRRAEMSGIVDRALVMLDAAPVVPDANVQKTIGELVATPDSLVPLLVRRLDPARPSAVAGIEVLVRRTFNESSCVASGIFMHGGIVLQRFLVDDAAGARRVAAALCPKLPLADVLARVTAAWRASGWQEPELDVVVVGDRPSSFAREVCAEVPEYADKLAFERVTLTWHNGDGLRLRTFTRVGAELQEDELLRDIHPEYARRFELHRLSGFALRRIDTPEPVHAFFGTARDNPRDERIFVYTGVRSVPDSREIEADPSCLWELERAFYEGVRVLREAQVRRNARKRFHWNRLTIYVRRPIDFNSDDVAAISSRLEGPTRGLGLEKVVVRCRMIARDAAGKSTLREAAVVIGRPGEHRLQVTMHTPTVQPVRAMSDYAMKVVGARRMGLVYPYELVHILTGERSSSQAAPPHPDLASGRFVEHDLDADTGELVPVDRAYGGNTAAVVVGTIRNPTPKHPDGILRVLIANDPTQAMCALAEPECRRILGALRLAKRLDVPVEWIAISAGAKIAMDSGTENLDWTAAVLRGLVEHTQAGGVVHVLVCGVNVGAQSYWNAEATMLMHTRGLLIMTQDGSCVLTGKKALEVSGSVAAEDERGIGGWERVMGPNGQAQLFAQDLGEAYSLLMDHYRFTWREPDELGPRRHATADPANRDIGRSPYVAQGRSPGDAGDFKTVGEIFDDATNPGRKRPFDVRAVMAALIDRDGGSLERYSGMSEGETAVIWDAHVGGFPLCLIGFESRPLARRGRIPTDGPDTWTGGTLFPQSSKKVARAINAASGNRPVVVLANLSGFDGSPESLRRLQLEYGAEIGRSVVNFKGPIIFVVIGRYHGGAYVVFSKALNPELTSLALVGSFASVIGGGPAAAVVFPREVTRRAEADPRIKEARDAVKSGDSHSQPRLRERLDKLLADVRLQKQGEVAAEFDAIHTVQRAVDVGSLDAVIPSARLRPEIIARLTSADAAQQRDPMRHPAAHA